MLTNRFICCINFRLGLTNSMDAGVYSFGLTFEVSRRLGLGEHDNENVSIASPMAHVIFPCSLAGNLVRMLSARARLGDEHS